MAGFGIPPRGPIPIVPHPSMMLILAVGAGRATLEDSSGCQHVSSIAAPPGFGAGVVARARDRGIECVQVRLSPVVSQTMLGASPGELDGAVSLEDLWGADATRIRQQLAEASSWEERFRLTGRTLDRRRAAGSPIDRELAWAWDRILRDGGRGRIDELANELGWSRKRLWSRFQMQLGMAPKRAAGLVRFDHAAHRLVAGEGPSHAAAESGYADQSHLHRDVMAFCGVTPVELAREPFLAVDDRAWGRS